MRIAILCLLAFACSKSPQIPADRPTTMWWGDADARNKAQLPAGFTLPDVHQCAADPTRQYVGELFFHGLSDIQVTEHWAPIVPGPTQRRTLNQPEFSLAGTIAQADDSGDDVLGDHPFGTDIDADIAPDAQYAAFAFDRGAQSSAIHTEVENRIFPRAALGFTPQKGDRVLMRGAWVLDCGHPPYGAEIHPPTFLQYTRATDASTTIGAVIVTPYRSSLVFNPDPNVTTDFASTTRFSDFRSKSFSESLVDAVLGAAATNADHLTTHALMVANKFDTLDWLVCAPLPRPAGASLDATWRLTARTGVQVSATPDEKSGCVHFVATMGSDYVPAPLTLQSAPWPWDELSSSASSQLGQAIDVRQAIINLLGGNAGSLPALQADHPPQIDAYAALQPRAGADQDAPVAITSAADDQPFPLYGRIRVAWH